MQHSGPLLPLLIFLPFPSPPPPIYQNDEPPGTCRENVWELSGNTSMWVFFFFLLFFCEQQMLLSNLSSRLKSTIIIGAEVGWNKLWTGIWTVIINYVDLFEGDDGTLDAIYTTEAILSISMGHPIDKNGMMSWLFMMILNSKATNGIWVWQHHQLFEVQWVDAFCH